MWRQRDRGFGTQGRGDAEIFPHISQSPRPCVPKSLRLRYSLRGKIKSLFSLGYQYHRNIIISTGFICLSDEGFTNLLEGFFL